MASYVIQSETLEAIGDAIRDKTDSGDLIAPKDMASKIMLIDTAKEEQEKSIDITENGTTEVTPDEGKALSKVTVNVEVESGGGAEITAGFTSEKYKKWLEVNGYTIVNFTLTSQATADFNINHPLGRPANSIICFRADLDSEPDKKRIGFAISLDGSTADIMTNRLVIYNNTYMTFSFGVKTENLDYRAILENTAEHIKLRYVTGGANNLVWASGDYYLAVL